jgi:hypothetical protein
VHAGSIAHKLPINTLWHMPIEEEQPAATSKAQAKPAEHSASVAQGPPIGEPPLTSLSAPDPATVLPTEPLVGAGLLPLPAIGVVPPVLPPQAERPRPSTKIEAHAHRTGQLLKDDDTWALNI